MRPKHESERMYLTQAERIDNPRRWESESGYFRGTQELGEDAGENTLVDYTITPSGSPTRQTGESAGGGWVDAFKAVLPAVAGVVQQREYNKMNLALINSGKPPISPQQYQVMQPATANVMVGPTADAKKWMIYAGVAVLGILGLRAAKII